MNKFLVTNSNRRFNFTSRYNVKLYKKSLSLKLIINNKDNLLYNQPNISFKENELKSVFNLKCIYARRELVPLRLLKFFFFVNSAINLVNLNINFFVAQKLSVYSGRLLKFINTNIVC